MNKEDESNNADYNNEGVTMDSKKAVEYVQELLTERFAIDFHELPNASRLVEDEISKVQAMGRVPNKYVDLYREAPVMIATKLLIPPEYRKFNVIGKLMGPKGVTMKQLQEETMCRISVLGRGSMKDQQKEEECRTSLDPKYIHLASDLHVKISAYAKPTEAYARIAFALEEIKKYLLPDEEFQIEEEEPQDFNAYNNQPRGPRRGFQRQEMGNNFKAPFSHGPGQQGPSGPQGGGFMPQNRRRPPFRGSNIQSGSSDEDYNSQQGQQWKYNNEWRTSQRAPNYQNQNRGQGYRSTPY